MIQSVFDPFAGIGEKNDVVDIVFVDNGSKFVKGIPSIRSSEEYRIDLSFK
jgi:hypothetical protein